MASVLAPAGWAAVEVDTRAADAVASLGRAAFGDPIDVSVHSDLSGRPRVVAFSRPAP
jgi:methylase of polypeptide subunit release factors